LVLPVGARGRGSGAFDLLEEAPRPFSQSDLLPKLFETVVARCMKEKDGAIRYRAAQHDCDACMLKPKCCPNMFARKIARSVHKAAPDKTRAIAKTEAYAISCRERKRSKCSLLF
jgi:hypothetical protein